MSFGDRLKQYIDYKRTNIRAFELKSGLKNGTVYKVVKNNTSLNGDSIEAIGKAWNDIDLNWLILGEGNMLKTEASSDDNGKNDLGYKAQLTRADSQIELQNDMINLLKKIIQNHKIDIHKIESE